MCEKTRRLTLQDGKKGDDEKRILHPGYLPRYPIPAVSRLLCQEAKHDLVSDRSNRFEDFKAVPAASRTLVSWLITHFQGFLPQI